MAFYGIDKENYGLTQSDLNVKTQLANIGNLTNIDIYNSIKTGTSGSVDIDFTSKKYRIVAYNNKPVVEQHFASNKYKLVYIDNVAENTYQFASVDYTATTVGTTSNKTIHYIEL